jgi:hypothetical protein
MVEVWGHIIVAQCADRALQAPAAYSSTTVLFLPVTTSLKNIVSVISCRHFYVEMLI